MQLRNHKQRGGESVLSEQSCDHCGTRFRPSAAEERFCCSGCEYVYRIIHDESLERFYDLRGSVSRPVGSQIFQSDDYPWLDALFLAAEKSGGVARLSLALEGISCVGCVWLIDKVFSELPGGVSCRVNVQAGSLDLEWLSGTFDLKAFLERIRQFGYRVCPARERETAESRRIAGKLGLAGAFALNGMLYTLPTYLGMEADFLVATHFNWLSAVFASLSMLICGSYFMGRAAKAALRGIAHLDLPISVGILFAYSVSWYGLFAKVESLVYFDFVSTFIFLMLVGRWLQTVAVERNRNRLADIQAEAPEVELENDEGERRSVSAESLRSGQAFWLRPGSRSPVRSRLLSEKANWGMDWVSGESESQLLTAGCEVASGAELETPFAVRMEAMEDWEQSLLCQLSRKGADALERDQVAQRWIFRYLAFAFVLALGGGVAWSLVQGLEAGLSVFISVLVVSCPCALGIAWPFGDEIALAKLKGDGVFVTTHTLWNRLSRVRRIVFDKTGTLTRSSMQLANPEVIADLDLKSLSALSSLVAQSRHPVAKTIRESLMAKGRFQTTASEKAEELVGLGLQLRSGSQIWRLGKADWAGVSEGRGTVLSLAGKRVAEFHFEDRPLPDSATELNSLAGEGYDLAILSGDRLEKAQAIGRTLGLPSEAVVGGLLPEEKASWIQSRSPESTLMIGDGANDTLAFRASLCCGAPANEQGIVADHADFHFLGNGISGIRRLLAVGSRRRTTVRRLMAFAVVYNLTAIALCLGLWVTPLVAAVLMPLSSIGSLMLVWASMREV